MRLEIDGGGYETARDAFATGNQLAAMAHQRLVRALAAAAGMAGGDAVAAGFATAYDESAREAVGALADLVDSFAGVGRLTDAALAQHRRAEARSVVNGSTVYEGGLLTDTGYVAVLPTTPPSSLGANAYALPGKVEWILDHVSGFVWPDADVDRVRAAAATWQSAADGLGELVTCCEAATRGFWRERSPEIPLALDATDDLGATIRDVAGLLTALGSQCTAYADDVEDHRHQVLALAEWLLEQVVEGILISVGIGLITGGAGAGAAGAAVVARIVAESRRFEEILAALRGLAAAVGTSTRATRDLLKASRLRLVKFQDAAVVRAGVRDERGAFDLSAFRLKVASPKVFDPQELRGMSPTALRNALSHWKLRPASQGDGLVYVDPMNKGRQIRVMEGYPGNRPDPLTHGPYAVVSQNGHRPVKIALEGNPTL